MADERSVARRAASSEGGVDMVISLRFVHAERGRRRDRDRPEFGWKGEDARVSVLVTIKACIGPARRCFGKRINAIEEVADHSSFIRMHCTSCAAIFRFRVALVEAI